MFSLDVKAQEGNVWAFGDKAGVNFNTSPPTPILTAISTSEGCASICDASGQLLFYTDGTSAWNRNHNLMPNGTNLTGAGNITSSTTQGALIVPMPGNTGKYYIFSLGNRENAFYFGRLYYSVVDMSLNAGLGDVASKGKLMDSMLTEHMTCVAGDNCNIWLLVISRSDAKFKVYNIDFTGIASVPVVSPRTAGGGTSNGLVGCIDISPDRSKIAVAQGNLVMYDFDAVSGTVTQPMVLDNSVSNPYYGVCFSPGNTKLYATSDDPIWQFDLSLPGAAAIAASKTLLSKGFWPAIRRGPDGKVYCASTGRYLHVVNRPDIAGTPCQFVYQGFPLLTASQSQLGLPNATIATRKKVYRSRTDTVFCKSQLLLTATDASGTNYVWENNNTGPTRMISGSGTYWVRYEVSSPCMLEEVVDTFKVFFDFSVNMRSSVTADSGLCRADVTSMTANNHNGSDYIWDNGSAGKERQVNQSGIYWVSYDIDSLCEHHVDSFIIYYPEPGYKVSFSTDTLVCQDEQISFRNTSDVLFSMFNWSFGDQHISVLENPQHVYSRPGSYRVMLVGRINDICSDTAYLTIDVDAPSVSDFTVEPDSICSGESVTFYPQAGSTVTGLHWQFGDGKEMATGAGESAIRHVYDTSGTMRVILTTHFSACPDTSFSRTVHVDPLPQVYLGEDTSICVGSAPVVLVNLTHNAPGDYHYLWNTGDKTRHLNVDRYGVYSLTVSSATSGCAATDSVRVEKDCFIDIPNGFTPNNDGVNDYFFPGQKLSGSVTRFRMQIFNRWGQEVFSTTDINGRGWDGKLNGKDQPQGVYIYVIDAVINGIRNEHRQGNLTLVR